VVDNVAIVAMGMSSGTYLRLAASLGSRHKVADETWAINSMGGVIEHDLLFHMDDCKVQEARAERKPDNNVAGMLGWLKDHPKFMTSKAYPDYPGAIEFPLQEVIQSVGSTYFNSTVAYAVAYAIHLGVKKISLYGVDYSYANSHKSESGRGCVEFLLGIAAARGIHIEVASDSTLLDANVDPRIRPYGYDAYDVSFELEDGKLKVIKDERESLPTPEEIEKRYKHEE
jgi:hypothetical protein